MKKFVISFLLAALFAASTYAQDKKVEFSLRGGFSYDMPRTASDTLFNSGGIHIGPMITYNINEMFGIQAGLLYNYYSSVILLDNISMKRNGTWKQNKSVAQYIDLPLRFQYNAILTDEMTVHLFAGPNFNYALSRVVNFERYTNNKINTGYPHTLKDYYSSSSYFKPFDVQFGLGASIQYLKYSLIVNYDWGLLDKDKSFIKFKENNIKVGVAYTF